MLFLGNVVTFRGNEPGVNPIRTTQGIERSDCCLKKSVLKLQLRTLNLELTEDAGVLSFNHCRNLDRIAPLPHQCGKWLGGAKPWHHVTKKPLKLLRYRWINLFAIP